MFNYKNNLEFKKRSEIVEAYDELLYGKSPLTDKFNGRMLLEMMRDRKIKIEDQLLHEENIRNIAKYTGNIELVGAVQRYVDYPDFKPKYDVDNPIYLGGPNRSLESALFIVPVFEQFVPVLKDGYNEKDILSQERIFIHVKKAKITTNNYLVSSERVAFPAILLDSINQKLLADFIDINHRFPNGQEKQRLISETCQIISDERLCIDYNNQFNDKDTIARVKTNLFLDFTEPIFSYDIKNDRAQIFNKYGVTFDDSDDAWLEISKKIYDNRHVTIRGKVLTLSDQRRKQI